MNRREFLRAGTALAASAFLPSIASAQSTAAAITLEGWELKAPTNTVGMIPPDPQTGRPHILGNLFKGFADTFGQSGAFVHLYIKMQDGKNAYYLHGLPCDPETGAQTEMSNPRAVLKVKVMTAQNSKAAQAKHGRASIPSVPLEMPQDQSAAEVFASLLDVAEAINAQNIPYQAASLNRANPPTNSNAVAAALLRALGYCEENACPTIETTVLNNGHFAPGINAVLVTSEDIGSTFSELAKQGKSSTELFSIFNKISAPNRPTAPTRGRGKTAAL